MASFPNDKDGKIEYFEQRLPQWVADPASVGLTADQVAALALLVLDARSGYTAAQQGKQDTRNLIFTQDIAINSMMGLGTALVATIRAFADATGQLDGDAAFADVYTAANLSPFNAATPLAPPSPATNLQASLLNSGGIKLTWNGTTANGTVYSVWRRTNNETSFTQLATSGQRTYEDQTVPAGSTEVLYFLKTIRDELTSDDSESITVRLGVTAEQSTDTGTTELGLAA